MQEVKRKAQDIIQPGPVGKQSKAGEAGPIVGGTNKHHTNAEFYQLLVHTPAQDLRPPQNTVFVAERTDKVVDVFKGLVKHNFTAVPVLQKTGRKWYGFLDMADIVAYVCDTFGGAQLSTTEDFWELFNKEEKFRAVTVNDIMRQRPFGFTNPFHPVKGGFSLSYAIEALAKERNLYRVAVVDDERQLLNLITDSQVLNFIAQNIDAIGPKIEKPVSEIPHVLKDVAQIEESRPAIDAFKLMVQERISGVAIVNKKGEITDTLSLRDLKAMAPDGALFWRLYGPAQAFLQKLHQEYAGKGRPHTLQTATVNDTLKNIITNLHTYKIHRIFIVNDKNIPVGVVTLKDVLLEIMSK